MDINTKTMQHPAVAFPSSPMGNKQAADPLLKVGNNVTTITDKTSSAEADVAVNSEVKPEDLKQAVSQLNDYVQNMQRNLQFSVDKESGITVVKVIDAKNDQVIRQMPNEEALKLARSLAEQNQKSAINIFSSRA